MADGLVMLTPGYNKFKKRFPSTTETGFAFSSCNQKFKQKCWVASFDLFLCQQR